MIIKNELLAGVTIAVASFIWICLEYIIGFHDRLIDYHPYVTNLAYILPVIGVNWAVKKRYAAQTPEAFEIKDGLMSGVIVAVTSAFLLLPLLWIFVTYINPAFFGNMIAGATKKALMSGDNSVIALQDAKEYFNLSSYLIQSFTSMLMLGVLISLMVSFRLIKKRRK
ncbi:DUF4199 domain-containing protein [Cytophaga aurantiaca]|uniref:DUF4199 domain-containing protein n=1 Tax=Cytophaga aurantiaca TaxID=29530 RepID=UPI00037E5334|nr:DUF4199 domain-containing protein [Cytophaga aurantiaca]